MYKNISSRKNVDFFRSVSKNIIPNNASPTFQEVGGVAQRRIFCRKLTRFSWYRINHHKLN